MSVLVGRKAPDFIAAAVLGNGEIVNQYHFLKEIDNKYALVFFYPLDFTFVCPSELIALDNRIEEFKQRKVEVLTVSIDSHFTHSAWRNTAVQDGGIGQVRYTMIADISHEIAQAFGVEHPSAHVALRGAFLIDRQGIVRAQVVNDLPIGRNMDELLRLVDALQYTEEHGEVCPAGWSKGQRAMKASKVGVAEYLAQNAESL